MTDSLKRPDETDLQPRVVHDVDCVAAMLTLREGRVVHTLDDARAVFVTGSRDVVVTVNAWYRKQGGEGVSPIIRHLQISNLAWLKKPAAAPELKIHELTALCEAALRPSKKTWLRFLQHLRSLEESNELTSDEAVAIIVSGLTDKLLVDLEDAQDHDDAESYTEVVARVKATYRKELEGKVRDSQEAELATRKQLRQVELHMESRIRLFSRLGSWAAYWAVVAALVFGSILGLPGVITSVGSPIAQRIGFVLAGLFLAAGILSVTVGWRLIDLRVRLEEWLARLFRG